MISPRVGDVVREKGGKLRMIIERVNSNGTVEVYWHVDHIRCMRVFRIDELEKCYV